LAATDKAIVLWLLLGADVDVQSVVHVSTLLSEGWLLCLPLLINPSQHKLQPILCPPPTHTPPLSQKLPYCKWDQDVLALTFA
jgi:hypothetical protein